MQEPQISPFSTAVRIVCFDLQPPLAEIQLVVSLELKCQSSLESVVLCRGHTCSCTGMTEEDWLHQSSCSWKTAQRFPVVKQGQNKAGLNVKRIKLTLKDNNICNICTFIPFLLHYFPNKFHLHLKTSLHYFVSIFNFPAFRHLDLKPLLDDPSAVFSPFSSFFLWSLPNYSFLPWLPESTSPQTSVEIIQIYS